MITGRFDQIAFGNRKQTNKHTRGRRENPPLCVIGVFLIAESYLVEPASNHMLVSEINPCMSNFILFHGVTANGSLNHSKFLTCHDPTLKTLTIPELN